MRILYDGWSLVYEPLGPASLHLLSILENIPGEINPVLALPEDTPGWLDFSETAIILAQNTPWGRLRWEQFTLPSLVKELRADLLHLGSWGSEGNRLWLVVVIGAGVLQFLADFVQQGRNVAALFALHSANRTLDGLAVLAYGNRECKVHLRSSL